MHPRAHAERTEAADAEMSKALSFLTERFPVEAVPPPEFSRQPDIQVLYQREHVARSLTALVKAVKQADQEASAVLTAEQEKLTAEVARLEAELQQRQAETPAPKGKA